MFSAWLFYDFIGHRNTYNFHALRVVPNDEEKDVATQQCSLLTSQTVCGLQLIEGYVVREKVARSQHTEHELDGIQEQKHSLSRMSASSRREC